MGSIAQSMRGKRSPIARKTSLAERRVARVVRASPRRARRRSRPRGACCDPTARASTSAARARSVIRSAPLLDATPTSRARRRAGGPRRGAARRCPCGTTKSGIAALLASDPQASAGRGDRSASARPSRRRAAAGRVERDARRRVAAGAVPMRSRQIGSVATSFPPRRSTNVACPIHVRCGSARASAAPSFVAPGVTNGVSFDPPPPAMRSTTCHCRTSPSPLSGVVPSRFVYAPPLGGSSRASDAAAGVFRRPPRGPG